MEATSIFILPSYLKVDTVVDARGLLSNERLLRCNKSDALFGVMMIVVIKQAINNYNRCHAEPNLTSTVLEHPLST
ncbi:hypothetical protein J1N35_041314 [Gossypium stocksii]|uniref:Uncharacterized protein n=1 Tax=Gossypium stocksii TaxID=47602 RepID=A0A9D3UFI1_9ROSI|nr:hypothetical protein J1N35_041314 [Gossypium stocksii]